MASQSDSGFISMQEFPSLPVISPAQDRLEDDNDIGNPLLTENDINDIPPFPHLEVNSTMEDDEVSEFTPAENVFESFAAIESRGSAQDSDRKQLCLAAGQKGQAYCPPSKTWHKVCLTEVSPGPDNVAEKVTVKWVHAGSITEDLKEHSLRRLEVNKDEPLVCKGMRSKCRIRPSEKCRDTPHPLVYMPGKVVGVPKQGMFEFQFDNGEKIADASIDDLLFVRVPTSTIATTLSATRVTSTRGGTSVINHLSTKMRFPGRITFFEALKLRTFERMVLKSARLTSGGEKRNKRQAKELSRLQSMTREQEGKVPKLRMWAEEAKTSWKRIRVENDSLISDLQGLPITAFANKVLEDPEELYEAIEGSTDKLFFIRHCENCKSELKLVRVNLDDTRAHEETSNRYKTDGKYYVEFYTQTTADLKLPWDESRWRLDYHEFTMAADGELEYGYRIEFPPNKNIDLTKYTVFGACKKLLDQDTILLGPFDFEEPGSTSRSEKSFQKYVPRGIWQDLKRALRFTDIPLPNLSGEAEMPACKRSKQVAFSTRARKKS